MKFEKQNCANRVLKTNALQSRGITAWKNRGTHNITSQFT